VALLLFVDVWGSPVLFVVARRKEARKRPRQKQRASVTYEQSRVKSTPNQSQSNASKWPKFLSSFWATFCSFARGKAHIKCHQMAPIFLLTLSPHFGRPKHSPSAQVAHLLTPSPYFIILVLAALCVCQMDGRKLSGSRAASE